jgi:hypothetical protein
MLTLRLGGGGLREVAVAKLVIAGWTGRDRASVDAHIEELARLGVSPPASVPVYYRVSSSLLTCAARIQVVGPESTGECEAVLLRTAGRTWIGVGSDHTDRGLERVSVSAAKQACAKPVGNEFWALEEVASHWDALRLRSFRRDGQSSELYQDGALATNLPWAALVAGCAGADGLADGTVLFCGTLPVVGPLRGAPELDLELHDPVMRRTLTHRYAVTELPCLA